MRLAIALVAALTVAATHRGCDTGGGDGIPDPWDDACEGHACGDPCDYCPPETPPGSCPVPAFAPTACNARGQCVTEGTFVCGPAETCDGRACGVSCDAWCPKGAPCPAPVVCDGAGACVGWSQDVCAPSAAACAGKACGETCAIDPPCASANPPCMMPSIPGWCDPDGVCHPGPPPPLPPAGCEPPPDPCAGKACGEPCDLCGGMCMHPYATACDHAGLCVMRNPWICYDPCEGKACGESCHACPPDATDCVEAAVMMACDATGRCTTEWPAVCPP